MNTRYLEYLIALEETGNMTKAAQKLYISQSNLSQFLSHEEKRIGQKLFQRINGRYIPTPVGEIYLEYAKKMIELTTQFNQKIFGLSGMNTLRIGTTSTMAARMLDQVLPQIRTTYPELQASHLDCNNLDTALYSLSAGKLDLAFVTAPSEDRFQGAFRILAKEDVFLGVPASLPGCSRYKDVPFPSLTARQIFQLFGKCHFVLPDEGSCIRYLVDDFFREHPFEYNAIYNASGTAAITSMIVNEIGLGFIPLTSMISSPRIKYFSLAPRPYRFHAVCLREDSPSVSLIEELIKYARYYYRDALTNAAAMIAAQKDGGMG